MEKATGPDAHLFMDGPRREEWSAVPALNEPMESQARSELRGAAARLAGEIKAVVAPDVLGRNRGLAGRAGVNLPSSAFSETQPGGN